MNTDEILSAWLPYINSIEDWQRLVAGVTPKATQCGPVYELNNPIVRPHESFAIADMRAIKVAEPHYHTGDETEIYIVLQGSGLTVVGGKEIPIKVGSVVVTQPETAHFTIPHEGLVLAVINTPPFEAANAKDVTDTDQRVGFDRKQYERLSA